METHFEFKGIHIVLYWTILIWVQRMKEAQKLRLFFFAALCKNVDRQLSMKLNCESQTNGVDRWNQSPYLQCPISN
jgi:hypothetical protein